jgi:hypothetical protein
VEGGQVGRKGADEDARGGYVGSLAVLVGRGGSTVLVELVAVDEEEGIEVDEMGQMWACPLAVGVSVSLVVVLLVLKTGTCREVGEVDVDVLVRGLQQAVEVDPYTGDEVEGRVVARLEAVVVFGVEAMPGRVQGRVADYVARLRGDLGMHGCCRQLRVGPGHHMVGRWKESRSFDNEVVHMDQGDHL